MTKWDYTTDVLIVGSGGGGMTAALVAKKAGLDVTVIEKSECYGGSTALSGGGVWIPNNYILEKKGIVDSMEKARTYICLLYTSPSPRDRQRSRMPSYA